MIDKDIFRLYDIRGVYPEQLSEKIAGEIANAFTLLVKNEFKRKPIISIGRDARLSSPIIFQKVLQAVTDAGADALVLGICPSPLTYFSMYNLNADAYIMITGSHNSPEYNGLKVGTKNTVYHSEKIFSIYDTIIKDGYFISDKKGAVSEIDINSKYTKWQTKHFEKLKDSLSVDKNKIKVVIDAGNGAASKTAPMVFNAVGAEVIELFCTEDGNFPNHHPDPTVEENLYHAKEAVKKNNADFAVCYDGDADRIGIVCEDGTPIWGDQLLGIFAADIAKTKKDIKVIADVKASQALFQLLDKVGADSIMWKSGHSMIKTKLMETKAHLAGEMSAHIFFNDRYFGFDDAIYASLRFLEAYYYAKKSGAVTKSSDFLKLFIKTYNSPEMRLECDDKIKFALSEKLESYFKDENIRKMLNIKSVIDIDGIRVNFHDGWGLVRASNTQPAIVIRVEASNIESFEKYKKIFLEKFEEQKLLLS